MGRLCLGWICYAEKTQGTYILPYISTAKSAQQIMGTLVKERLSVQLQRTYVRPCARTPRPRKRSLACRRCPSTGTGPVPCLPRRCGPWAAVGSGRARCTTSR